LRSSLMDLRVKLKKYLEQLQERGPALLKPFVDKIEGYKNLFELRPHFGNLEYRMFFFWKGNTAYFIHTFIEKGQKKKNQREYKIADEIKKKIERNM